jgi:hypothetical protein
VIKPWPAQPAVAGGFTRDDFTIDRAAGTVTCPAGITRQITASNAVTFGAACRGCPLRQRCTTAKDGHILHLHQHETCCTPPGPPGPPALGCARTTRHTPHVERAIAQVATWRGRRLKLRYRGAASNDAWLKRRTAAINLRNLLSRDLARRGEAWVLAT